MRHKDNDPHCSPKYGFHTWQTIVKRESKFQLMEETSIVWSTDLSWSLSCFGHRHASVFLVTYTLQMLTLFIYSHLQKSRRTVHFYVSFSSSSFQYFHFKQHSYLLILEILLICLFKIEREKTKLWRLTWKDELFTFHKFFWIYYLLWKKFSSKRQNYQIYE